MRLWLPPALLVACTGGGGGGETTTDSDTGTVADTDTDTDVDADTDADADTDTDTAADTGATSDTSSTTTGATGDTGIIPMLLDDTTLEAGVRCDPSGATVDFRFDFLGEASHGMVDVADTDNADGPYGNWNDYHSLQASDVTPDGGYTLLSASVETAVSPADWADAVSTIFVCAHHFEDAGVMTYAVRSYDVWGNLADCVAFGEDPAGFIAGERTGTGSDYLRYNPRIDEVDFAACRVSTAAN